MATIREPEIIEQNGVLIGPYRHARNLAQDAKGSIHDDNTASKLGFRGGTVAGSIHMEQFPPVLMRAFGQRWFETGSLSCYFRNATIDNERVRPLVQLPPGDAGDSQINVWMERDDGLQVLEGTASSGLADETSMVRRKLAEPRDVGEMRILTDMHVGQKLPAVPSRVRSDNTEVAARIKVVTEPLDWYSGASPWGGPVLNPGLVVHAMIPVQQGMSARRAVGLYGAIEIQHHKGPVFADHDYEVDGEILAFGTSPKTEIVWFQSFLREPAGAPDGGILVASMIMMLRFMKASSKEWAEG